MRTQYAPTCAEAAFRRLKLLVSGYFTLSVLTLGAIAALHNNGAAVNDAVWTRGSIVAITSALLLAFTFGAARGSRRAYLRLRLSSAIMLVAIAVIVALPGPFPLWLKVEQGVCGLILLGVVALANGQQLRSSFTQEGFDTRSMA